MRLPPSGTVDGVTSTRPDLSVVMVTRDRRDRTLNTLRHLLDLLDGTPVIVVDNDSSDGTADAVATEFPDLRIVRADRNLGAVGRNLGVAQAQTEYVAFADDDSWWEPGALPDAVKLFEESPRLGLLAARIIVEPNGQVDPVCEQMATSPLPRADDLPGPSILGFVACGAIVRRRAFLQAGGFNRLVSFGGEESILAIDLAVAGWGLAYVDGIVAHHHPMPHPDRAGRARLITRNAVLTAWLRRPFPVAARRLATFAGEPGNPQVRAGVLDAVLRMPVALRARRPVPRWLEEQLRILDTAQG